MLKKILLPIFFILIFAQATFAQEVFRVTSVNFDTTNSLILLTSPDNTSEAIMKNIKLTKLQNPKRIYFDINSAILTGPPQNWFLNSGGLKQVKVSQFSNNPDKIRIVLYLDEDFNQSQLSFLKLNNNIIIKLKDVLAGSAKNEYFQNTYRDEKASSSDFYQNLSISSENAVNLNKNQDVISKNDVVLDQLQQAFNASTTAPSNIKNVSVKTPDPIKKEFKLKSKYYLDLVSPKPNGFLLSGFGIIGVEKPMYLTNPARVVFDLPNSILNPSVINQEYKIGSDTVKAGQYGPNKVRITITSPQLEKYFPIFSSDGQSILFMNSEAVDIDSLFTKTTDAVDYYVKSLDPTTEEFIVTFNAPVIHSIRRDSTKLTMNFYNALRYNDQNFRNAVQPTGLSSMKIDLIPKIGLKLTLPLEKDSVVRCYLGADGKSIKIVVKGVIRRSNGCSTIQTVILPRCKDKNGKKSIVLDSGHGGSDYGAIRCGINEKDINLDVAKRVQAILTSKGVAVSMTRNSDETVSLESRTTFTANMNPNIFVSIHVNSSLKPEISGVETHYYHQESLELAQTVHESLISYVKSKDRGLFKSRFYVINHTDVPAILVEIGFISNDAERCELVSEQRKQQTAKAIADGILNYLNRK